MKKALQTNFGNRTESELDEPLSKRKFSQKKIATPKETAARLFSQRDDSHL